MDSETMQDMSGTRTKEPVSQKQRIVQSSTDLLRVKTGKGVKYNQSRNDGMGKYRRVEGLEVKMRKTKLKSRNVQEKTE